MHYKMYNALRKTSLLLLFYFPFFHFISGQEYTYSQYTTKDGLAGATAYGITQSDDGFLWICTETGLSRFDGVRFKTFTIEDGLPSNEVFGIFIDSKKRLWIKTFKNQVCYYYKGKIHNSQNDSILKNVRLKMDLGVFGETTDGSIFISDYAQDACLIKQNGQIAYLDKDKPSQEKIRLQSGIAFHPQLITFPPKIANHLADCEISPTLVDRASAYVRNRGGYVFSTLNRHHFFIDSSGNRISINTHEDIIGFKQVGDSGFATIKRSPGVDIYDLNFKHKYTYFKEYVIHDVFIDKEKNIWFATKGHGIFKIANDRFKNIWSADDKEVPYVRDIHRFGRYIYVGADENEYWRFDGVDDRYFQTDRSYVPVRFESSQAFFNKIPFKTYINCGGFDFLNIATNIPYYPNSGYSIRTIQFFEDTLLIASIKGLHIVDRRKRTVVPLFTNRTTCGYKLNGVYYIGTVRGLFSLTPDSTVKPIPEINAHISTLAEGKDGILWVATFGSGVYGYKNGKVEVHLSSKNGLVSNTCRCLYVSDSALWVGTEKGLNKVSISNGKFSVTETVTIADGLNSNVINSIYSEGSFVYAGTPVGMTIFDMRSISRHSISHIAMTGITVSGKPINPFINDIHLKHEDNNISFEYAGISFLSERNIIYKYRIRELNDEWSATTENVLNYPSLPSGDYTLQLVAINKYKDESEVLEYRFSIEKTLLETFWFQVLLVVVIVVIISLIIWYSIRQSHVKERNKLMVNKKILELEQMALRAQMNPHFIFNCLNSMQQHIVSHDIKKANFYLSKFAGLVRATLDNSTKIYITLKDEINYLTNYIELERLQLENTFSYRIKVDPSIDPGNMRIANMVLQPYVENAIKHGLTPLAGDGRLLVSFQLDLSGARLKCIVEDNGLGIAETKKLKSGISNYESRGMSITDSRIMILNQLDKKVNIFIKIIDLHEEDRKKTGTRVTIYFPIVEGPHH